jgi:hypothetical protein
LQDPSQVRLAKDDEMIEALAPDRSDQPFRKAILPRCSRRYRLVPNAHGTNTALGDVAIDVIIIAEEVTWRPIPGERFSELTCDPFCGRIMCHVNPDQLSPVQPDYDKGIEQVEADGGDYEQIHGTDVRGMILQKSAPSLTGWAPSLDHVFGHCRLCDLKAKL